MTDRARADCRDTDTKYCIWCEEGVEDLVTNEVSSGFLVAGPGGEVLTMTYGDVCPGCWDSIRDEWERTGELTKPLSVYGGDE